MKKTTLLFLMLVSAATYAQTPVNMPYSNDFNEPVDTIGWTLENPSGKGEWIYSPDYFGINQSGSFIFMPSSSNASDNWVFSIPFNFIAGQNYSLDFKYLNLFTGYSSDLFVSFGTQANSAGMTTQIVAIPNYMVSNFTASHSTFSVPATGVYYLGFHDLGNFGTYGGQTFEDLSITETTDITSESVNEISIYPNPCADYLSVNNLEEGIVSVYTMQGELQKVIDVSEGNTKIDISNLNAGLYIVKVVKGNLTYLKRIVHVL